MSGTKTEQLLNLWEEVKKCKCCPISEFIKNHIFGEGDPDSPIVFVGEAPGNKEDEDSSPFSERGSAGNLFTRSLKSAKFNRDELFITNILQCHPAKFYANDPPDNRTPIDSEIRNCFPWLVKKLDIIKPKLIVAVGAVAMKALTATKIKITEVVEDYSRNGLTLPYQPKIKNCELEHAAPVYTILHPSFIARQGRDFKVQEEYIRDIKKIFHVLSHGRHQC